MAPTCVHSGQSKERQPTDQRRDTKQLGGTAVGLVPLTFRREQRTQAGGLDRHRPLSVEKKGWHTSNTVSAQKYMDDTCMYVAAPPSLQVFHALATFNVSLGIRESPAFHPLRWLFNRLVTERLALCGVFQVGQKINRAGALCSHGVGVCVYVVCPGAKSRYNPAKGMHGIIYVSGASNSPQTERRAPTAQQWGRRGNAGEYFRRGRMVKRIYD